MKIRSLICVLIGWFSWSAFPAQRTLLGDSGVLVELGTDLHFTDSKAAEVAGAEFSKKFTHLDVFQGSVSFLLFEHVSLGIRYHYWLGEQNYSLSGTNFKDSLHLQELAGTLGFQFGNPRVRYRVVAAVGYPVDLKVVQTGGSTKNFLPEFTPLLFDGRFQVILKLNSTFSWLIEAGYRRAELGIFKSGTENYISSGATFDLSGPLLGTSVGIHF